ncbi:hypothetical protein ABBQ32_002762 [Trebouxia sp. C0010 RCD-2024]
MGAWGKTPASSPQGKTGHKTVVQAGAAAVNTLAKQYDKPVRWRLQGNLEERLKTWYQPVTREAPSDRASSFSEDSFQASLPLRLQLTGSASGNPDLRLQLFSFRHGTACQHVPRPPADHHNAWMSGVINSASKAGTLMFLRLVFADEMAGTQMPLMALGAASLVGQAALTTPQQRQLALKQLRRRSSAVPRRFRHAAAQIASGAWPAAKQVARLPGDYATPAFGLWVGAHVWAYMSPHSYHVMQCLAASVPVMAGYAQTKRAAASGRLAAGEATEAAFRARHRWAARRVAHLLKGLPDRPPLQTASEVLESASVNVGLVVDGRPFLGSSVDVVSASGGLEGISFSIGASLPVRRGKRGPDPKPPAPPPSMAPPPKSSPQTVPLPAGAEAQAPLLDMASSIGGDLTTDGLPTISNRGELAPSMGSSSSSRRSSDPLSSEPGTPTHLPTLQNLHHLQGSSASTITDSPATSSSWADSGLPSSEHRVGRRIAELQKQTQQHDAQTQPESGDSEESRLDAAGTMLLSEVNLGDGRGARGGAAEPLPSSRVQLNDGRVVNVTGNDANTEAAPLFGRGDHAASEQALTVRDRCDLLVRASFLVTVFLPFLLLGPLLLLLAAQFTPTAQAQGHAASLAAATPAAGPSEQEAAPAQKNLGTSGGEVAAIQPAQASASRTQAVGVASQLRTAAFKLLLMGCRSSGAAFIKWGQWSATREDIFPADFCRVLSELHDKAPVHGWEASKAAIETAFGLPVDQMFESIAHNAIASGSIAQVLKPVAAATSKVRALKGLSLKESVSQFSSTMTAQADLRVECAHLRRFYNNFASVSQSVTPPYPFPGCETAEVLIETFEPGESVAKYIREPSPFNTQIVSLGVDTYLKMLLADNFVHTDLHPGNIMVRIRGTDRVSAEHKSLEEIRSQLQLVLLDFGLAEELTPRVRKHFISFLHMISAGNGRKAAYHMLLFSTKQECPRPQAFADDMETLFGVEAQISGPDGIDVDKVLKDVLKLARRHEVGIDSSYAALVLGVCVIVGFATSLDNRINIMDAATPCFLQHSLTGKASGRLY